MAQAGASGTLQGQTTRTASPPAAELPAFSRPVLVCSRLPKGWEGAIAHSGKPREPITPCWCNSENGYLHCPSWWTRVWQWQGGNGRLATAAAPGLPAGRWDETWLTRLSLEAELRSGPFKGKKKKKKKISLLGTVYKCTGISKWWLADTFGNRTQLSGDLLMALCVLGHQLPLYSNRSWIPK